MSRFKIAAAQIATTPGNVAANLTAHEAAAAAASTQQVAVVLFPELSLTGYEPGLAASLAFAADDSRVDPLRRIAVQYQITVVAGAPMRNGTGKPAIGAFIATPDGDTRTYRKMHLGAPEAAHFSSGDMPVAFDVNGQRLGIAICADSSCRSHPQTYRDLGAGIYAAGVCLTEQWYAEDAPRLQKYAADFGMLVVMANHGASAGTYAPVGRSAVWAPGGELLVQAGGVEDALVIATIEADRWRGDLLRM